MLSIEDVRVFLKQTPTEQHKNHKHSGDVPNISAATKSLIAAIDRQVGLSKRCRKAMKLKNRLDTFRNQLAMR